MMLRLIFYVQPETLDVENFFSTHFYTQRNRLSQCRLDVKM